MSSGKIIWGRTGEVLISPGFWWAQHKADGRITIVEVFEEGKDFRVMFMGNLNWPKLEEAAQDIEFLCPVENAP